MNDPFFPDGLPEVAAQAGAVQPAARARKLPPALTPAPDPAALLRALAKHWVLAVGLGASAAAVAGGAAWKLVPKSRFTASSLIEVKTQSPVLLSETSRDRVDYKIFQATQLALVKSRLVLSATLARPAVAELETIRAQADPTGYLEDHVEAEFQAGSELMRVSLAGDRPGDLAAIVNAVCESYLDEILTKDHNERAASSAKLKGLLDEYNDKLTGQRTRLRKLAESVGSDDKQTLAMKQQLAVQQLSQEQSELLRVQGELKRSLVELAVLKETPGTPAPRPVSGALVEEALSKVPSYDRLKQQADDLAIKLARVRRLVRNESDPSVRDARARLDNLNQALDAQRAELRPKIEEQLRDGPGDRRAERLAELGTQVKILTEYEKVLKQGIARLEVEAQSFNRQTIDLQWMKDEITQGEEVARHLGRQMESLNVELKAPQRGRVVEPADNPRADSARKRFAAIGMVAIGAFGLSILGVSWREYRLRLVDTPEEVVDGLNLRLVGTLPALPAPGRRGRPPGVEGEGASPEAVRWQNLLVESVDAARTVLMSDCRADDARAVMITSAMKGEGKSSLASHLAISLARAGRRTVLVDFDLRSPSLHRLFDVARSPGVCELLRGENEVGDTARPLMADLDVIPAGVRDAAALRALTRENLPALIDRLKLIYEYVVIDTAPVLPVADSLLIGQHADAVVLSVYRDVSRLPAVYAGYERLASLGVRVLGVVVTGLPAERYGEAYHYSEAAGS